MTEDSFLALQTAIAGVIASACADPNDGIAWAAERDVHMLTASQIIDDFLDPEVDAAETRGAIKALARINDDLLNYRDKFRERRGSHTRWALGVEDAAGEVRTLAARIESGEVTL